jgi:multisubunit Na+/H+ antiporter MnhF subunit
LSELSNKTAELPWYRGPAFILLVMLLSVYAVSTFLGLEGLGAYLIKALLMVSLILGVRRITRSSKALNLTLVIVLIGVVGQVAVNRFLEEDALVWDVWMNLVFFAAVLACLVWALVKAERVNADTVFAASSVYVLLGIVCAYAFILVHAADPTAFSLSDRDMAQPGTALLHYSFTTLTTVGYGSISPMSDVARMISDLEALIAQLYLAVVLARLVSLEIEHSRKTGRRES